MLREVATVSPLFFKEVRPQSPLLKLFLEFYHNSFGKKLPFHQGLSVLIRFQSIHFLKAYDNSYSKMNFEHKYKGKYEYKDNDKHKNV